MRPRGWKWRARRAYGEWRAPSGRAAAALGDFRLATTTRPESFLRRLVRFVKRDAVVLPNPARVSARRKTEDLRCARADVANAFARELLEPVDVHAFATKQIAFHFAAVRVVADSTAGGHHAMARHDERQAVSRDDVRHRPYRPWLADLLGEPGVAPYFAFWDLAHHLQHVAFELGRVAQVDRRFLHT